MKHLPNALTCCNLICGIVGIIFLWEEEHIPAAYFVWAACVFDFFDGFAARLLTIASPIGKELDSLADIISFGALPALFIYKLLDSFESTPPYLPYIAILIVVCSAIRLAVFNNDETQSDSFRGLPTPANAIFLTALPFLTLKSEVFGGIFTPVGLSITTAVCSILMVSRFKLFALKFKNFTWAQNKLRFTFLLLSVLLFVILHLAALPLIIILYLALSIAATVISK